MTALLAARHPGARVATVEVLEVHEVTNTHARLHVTYDVDAGAPDSLFCKLPPLDEARATTIAATGMGGREARFYESLAGSLALRVPTAHGVTYDDADGSFVLLLEDLATTGCTVSSGPEGVAPDSAARALAELAELHVRFEDSRRRAAEAAWVQPAGPGSDYAIGMLRYGIEHHRDRLADAFVAVAETYMTRRVDLQEVWESTGPHTVIHGDPHIGNVFDDHGRTGFLDWGIIRLGPALRDVSYFLTMAMTVADRRAHERDLLLHYLDVRASLGGSTITFDEAWTAHRLHAAYCVPASCQVVTFPENASTRRRVFADAFLERANAAVDDLDAVAALRELGIS